MKNFILLLSLLFTGFAYGATHLQNDTIADGYLIPKVTGQALGDSSHKWLITASAIVSALGQGFAYVDSSGNILSLSYGASSTYYRGDGTLQTLNTTAVAEGSNLYYTTARFDTAFATKSTTDLVEGTNLYFTNVRFDSRFDTQLATKTTTNLAEGANLYYTAARFNTAFSGKSTTDLAEGTNLYYTPARFNTAFAAKTTADLTENTNLYYTDARVRAAVSGTAPIVFNSGTGAFSCAVATGSIAGCLAAADFTTFAAKQDAGITGDVGVSGTTSTISNDAVTNAKAANMAQSTIKGRAASAGTGDPTDLSPTQAQAIVGSVPQVMVQQSTPSTPSAGTNALYFKSDDKVYKINSAGTEVEVGSGSSGGAGAFNIAVLDTAANSWAIASQTSSDAETSVGNWAAYADAAGVIPVDLTAGSPNTTCTRNTSSPINGTGDFKMTVTTGATRQGEGCSLLVNIPTAYRGKPIRVITPYTTTGTIAAGDFVPYAYDVTNASLLAPSATISGINSAAGDLYSIFQTQTSTAQLRIGLHIARASNTGAVTINWDDFKVEPDLNQANVPVSDWQAYTPTYTGLGTVATSSMWWRRNGDSVEIEGKLVTGTTTGTEARLSLPNGIISDATKVPAIRVAGLYGRNNAGAASADHGGHLLIESGVSYLTFSANTLGGSSANFLTKANGNGAFGTGDDGTISARIPISGWSSGGGTSPILSLSDWTSFTMAITSTGSSPTKGTATVDNAQWRRVGDTMHIRWAYAQGAGSAGTGTYLFGIPSGYTADTAKFPADTTSSSSSNSAVVGFGSVGVSNGANTTVFLYDSTHLTMAYGNSSTNAYISQGFYDLSNASLKYSLYAIVPIKGWTSVSSGTLTAPRSEVFVTTGNGYGSTNTKIRRYTTTQTNVGPAITYADSSTLGATFTINETGVYSMGVTDVRSGAQANMGISRNSASLTTDIDSLSASERIAFTQSGGATLATNLSRTINLNAGDIIRVHDTGSCTGSTAYNSYFYITKVSN